MVETYAGEAADWYDHIGWFVSDTMPDQRVDPVLENDDLNAFGRMPVGVVKM